MNNDIVFTYNWNNKLDNKAFTTLRLKNNNKYRYERTYNIILIEKFWPEKRVNKGEAIIVDMRHFKIEKINQFIAYIDTGYSSEECKKMIRTMYKNKNIDWDRQLLSLILLKKTQNQCPNPIHT